jgi:hypothetical protein
MDLPDAWMSVAHKTIPKYWILGQWRYVLLPRERAIVGKNPKELES